MASNVTTVVANSVLILTFLALNTSLNLLNRWALGIYGFKYPIVMTTCHMAFSVLVLAPYMLCTGVRHTHMEFLRKGWKGVAAIGCFMAVNISLNNLSLVYITLSLNQIIRAALPVITALLAVAVERKEFLADEFGSLCMLATGVMGCVYEGSIHGSAYGVTICLVGAAVPSRLILFPAAGASLLPLIHTFYYSCVAAGMVSNALMMTFSGKILGEKLDVFRLTFYTSPVSMTVLLPFLYTREWHGFVEYWNAGHQKGVTGVLLAGSIIAVMYNVVHYLMIQRISSTGTCVVGQVKIVGLLVISTFLLGETGQWTTTMLIGAIVAMGGFLWYSNVNLNKQLGKSHKASKFSKDQPALIASVFSSFTGMPAPVAMLLLLVLSVCIGIYSYISGLSEACGLGLLSC